MLRDLINRFMIGEYDRIKYRTLELFTGSHGFKEKGIR